jgi:hypothetical protein
MDGKLEAKYNLDKRHSNVSPKAPLMRSSGIQWIHSRKPTTRKAGTRGVNLDLFRRINLSFLVFLDEGFCGVLTTRHWELRFLVFAAGVRVPRFETQGLVRKIHGTAA